MERSRRATKASGSARGGASAAIEQLKSLRQSGKKHVDVYEIKAEDAVFELLDDDEYSKLVAKRRHEAGMGGCVRRVCGSLVVSCAPLPLGGFVVGDKGLGYEDVGEECDWGENTYEEDDKDNSPVQRKGGKKAAKGADKKRPAEPQPDKRRTMQRMLAAAAQHAAPAQPVAKPAAGADDVLADILGGLDGAAGSSHAPVRAVPTTRVVPRPAPKRYACLAVWGEGCCKGCCKVCGEVGCRDVQQC